MIILAVLGLMALGIPVVVQKVRAQRRRLLLASQLRQALQNMVHALRIGVGFQQALAYVAAEGEMPLGAEWRRLLQAISVGSPWSGSLGRARAAGDHRGDGMVCGRGSTHAEHGG